MTCNHCKKQANVRGTKTNTQKDLKIGEIWQMLLFYIVIKVEEPGSGNESDAPTYSTDVTLQISLPFFFFF